jgi:hypothetical protein
MRFGVLYAKKFITAYKCLKSMIDGENNRRNENNVQQVQRNNKRKNQ